jgi:hypothetical protein
MIVTQTKSYLCGSEPVRKPLSKLPVGLRGERSQCGSAMIRSEEARQRHFEGLHLGLDDVRVPALATKHVSQPSLSLLGKPTRLLSPAIWVPHAITWRQWHLIITDEVSRGPGLFARVTPAYKATPKGLVNASAWRRFSRPPPPQRWQQNGSSCSRPGAVKRETTEKVYEFKN